MATKKTIEIVKSTAPVLEKHGEDITKVFYRLLFKNQPELKSLFNMTHQKQGTQPKVLANAIFQYAVHIDKLEALGGAVESIAQKHTSLSITPEMYPIVGENLLKAIQEVLGEAATTDIMNAWAEAYSDLAAIFIKREEHIYSEREQKNGGFRNQKEFVITKKVAESNVITSFYLKPKDDSPTPEFIPGQYIALSLEIPNSPHKHTRNYSLSDAYNMDYLRISVKKEEGNPKGIVSNYLHNHIKEGDSLNLGMPSGEFVLKNFNTPIVLIAGGVGITPLMSMYKSALHSHRKITFIQCALNSGTHAFKHEIAKNANSKTTRFTVYNNPLTTDKLGDNYDFNGYLSTEMLKCMEINTDSEFYFCGPKPFMANTLSILRELNIAEENINYEFFGPTEELEKV
ncbi:NO-inducible flavohemoprotein [Pseudofulvibacter geojedonensis]|uniref:nitric oxide dioxygenase n=1 Tax=Pseudofulvibacter geojedonensis TaxID=1123758 RepID=A0ABW3HZ09_9FLAO